MAAKSSNSTLMLAAVGLGGFILYRKLKDDGLLTPATPVPLPAPGAPPIVNVAPPNVTLPPPAAALPPINIYLPPATPTTPTTPITPTTPLQPVINLNPPPPAPAPPPPPNVVETPYGPVLTTPIVLPPPAPPTVIQTPTGPVITTPIAPDVPVTPPPTVPQSPVQACLRVQPGWTQTQCESRLAEMPFRWQYITDGLREAREEQAKYPAGHPAIAAIQGNADILAGKGVALQQEYRSYSGGQSIPEGVLSNPTSKAQYVAFLRSRGWIDKYAGVT